jgi:hypothetical protein
MNTVIGACGLAATHSFHWSGGSSMPEELPVSTMIRSTPRGSDGKISESVSSESQI